MTRCPVLTAVVGSLPRETLRHLYHRNSIPLPIDRRRYLSLSDSPDPQINPVADSSLLRVAILARRHRWWPKAHQIQSPFVVGRSRGISAVCERNNYLLLVTPPFFDCLGRIERQLRQLLAQRECTDHMGGLQCLPLWKVFIVSGTFV